MLYDDVDTEYYLNLVKDWIDPNPNPVIIEHDGFLIVRDDLLRYGAKIRGLDYFVKTLSQTEIVFGSCPATGFAQVSLPYVCNQYNKKTVLFMADRNIANRHPNQVTALELGAEIHWVPNGMLTVTEKRAKDYTLANQKERILLPIGLENDIILASLIKVARNLPIVPTSFWTVGSSGTFNRALQMAWPLAAANIVSVGHVMSDREVGRANYYKSPYRFDQPTKNPPPYPSVAEYDAKVWDFVEKYAEKGSLVWNIA